MATRSIEVAEAIGDGVGIAAGYSELGSVALEAGDFPNADRWYRKALKIREAAGEKVGIAAAIWSLAMWHYTVVI